MPEFLSTQYDDEIGNLRWAAPQHLTCGAEVLKRTGLSVREHQRRTIDTFVELQSMNCVSDLWHRAG